MNPEDFQKNKSGYLISIPEGGFAYMPKATVQAAIGGLPLAMGLVSGEIILTVAVVSIIVTAPIGALLIDRSYKKLLTREYEPDRGFSKKASSEV